MGGTQGGFGGGVFSLDIYPDAKNPEINTLYIGQSRPGPARPRLLPDRRLQAAARRPILAFAERCPEDGRLSRSGQVGRRRAWPSRPKIAKVSWEVADAATSTRSTTPPPWPS